MRVANSVVYARDLKELRVARIEAAEELRLHQVFKVTWVLLCDGGQVRGQIVLVIMSVVDALCLDTGLSCVQA